MSTDKAEGSLGCKSLRNAVVEFLRENKVLECSNCGEIFGFQAKKDGKMYCVDHVGDGQHYCIPPPPGLPPRQSPSMGYTSPLMVKTPEYKASLGQNVGREISAARMVKPLVFDEPSVVSDASRMNEGGLTNSTGISGSIKSETSRSAEQPRPPVMSWKKESPVYRVDDIANDEVVSAGVVGEYAACKVVRGLGPVDVSSTEAGGKGANVDGSPDTKNGVKKFFWKNTFYTQSIEQNAKVTVPFIWSPTSMLIQASADLPKLTEFQENLAIAVDSKALPVLDRWPELDEMVITEYEGQFYRGRVIGKGHNFVEVSFVDFGDTKRVTQKEEMFQINEELMKVPIFGKTVNLDIKVPNGFQLSPEFCQDVYESYYEIFMLREKLKAYGEEPEFIATLRSAGGILTLNTRIRSEIAEWEKRQDLTCDK